jgi:hypothetical protein
VEACAEAPPPLVAAGAAGQFSACLRANEIGAAVGAVA